MTETDPASLEGMASTGMVVGAENEQPAVDLRTAPATSEEVDATAVDPAAANLPADSASLTTSAAEPEQQLNADQAVQPTQLLSPASQPAEAAKSIASHLPRSTVMPKRSSSITHARTVSTMFNPSTVQPPPPNYHLAFLRLLLQRFPLLTGMHPDSLDDLAHHTRRLATHRGQVLAAEGDGPAAVYLIESGAYRLSKVSDQLWDDAADGYMQVTLAQLSSGEEVGSFSLIAAAKEQVKAAQAAKLDEGVIRKPPPPSFPPHPLTTTCTAPGHVYAIPLLPLLALSTSRPSLLRHLATDVLLHHAVHMRRFEGAEQYKMERQGVVDQQAVEAVRDVQQLQGTRTDRRKRLPLPRTKRPDHAMAAAVKAADVTWQEDDEDEQKTAESTAQDKRQSEKDERRRRRKEARQKREAARQQQQADMAATDYRTADQQRFATRAEKAWRKDERAVEAEEKEAVREEMKRRWAEGQEEARQEKEVDDLLSAREKKFKEREATQQPLMLQRQEQQERYSIQQLTSPRSQHHSSYTHSDDFEQHLQRMHSREADNEQQQQQQQEQSEPSNDQQSQHDDDGAHRGRHQSFISSTISLINSIARENHLQHILHPKAQQRPAPAPAPHHHTTHARRQQKTISWSEQATQVLKQQHNAAAAAAAVEEAKVAAAATIPEHAEGTEAEETDEQAETRLSSLSTSSFDPLSHLHLIYTPHSSTLLHPTLPDGSINPELIRTVEAGNEVFRLADLQRRSSAEAAEEEAAFPSVSFFDGADAHDGEGEAGRTLGNSLSGAANAAGMSAIMKGALAYAHIGARSRGASLNDDTANSNLRALREKRMSAMQAAMDRGEKVLAAAGLIANRQQQRQQQDGDGSFFVTDQQGDETGGSGGAGGGRASVAHMRQVSSMLSDPLALASMLTSSSAADLQMGNDTQGDRLQQTIQHNQHQRHQQQAGTQPTTADPTSLDATHMSAAEYLRLLYARHGLHTVAEIADVMVRDRLGVAVVEALDASMAEGGVLPSKMQALLVEAVAAVEAEMKRVEDIRAARRPIMEEDEEDEEQRQRVAEKAERKRKRQEQRTAKAEEMEARLTAEISTQLESASTLSSPSAKQPSPAASPKYITPTVHNVVGSSSDEDSSGTETETGADTATEDDTEHGRPRAVQPPARPMQPVRMPMPAARMPIVQPRRSVAAVEQPTTPTPQPLAVSSSQPTVATAEQAADGASSENAPIETSPTSALVSPPRAVAPDSSATIEKHPSPVVSPTAAVSVVSTSLPGSLQSVSRDELPSRQQTAPDRFISTPAVDDEEDDEQEVDNNNNNNKSRKHPSPLQAAVPSSIKLSSRAQPQFDEIASLQLSNEPDELSSAQAEAAAAADQQAELAEEKTDEKQIEEPEVEEEGANPVRTEVQDAAVEEATVSTPSQPASPKSPATPDTPPAMDSDRPAETSTSEPTEPTQAAIDETVDTITADTVEDAHPELLEHTYLLGENVSEIRKELQKTIADETVKLAEVLCGEEREKAEQARQEERRRQRREAAEAAERERIERERKAAEAEEKRRQLQVARDEAERRAQELQEQQVALEAFHASRPPSEQQERPDTEKKKEKLQSFDTTKPETDPAEQHAADESHKRGRSKSIRKKGRLAALLSPRLGTAPSSFSPIPESPQPSEPAAEEEEVEEDSRATTAERMHSVRAEVLAELRSLFGAEVRHHLLEKAVQQAAEALEEKKRERVQQSKQKRRAETEKQRNLQAAEAVKQAMQAATQKIEEEEARLLAEEETLKQEAEQRLHQLEQEKAVEDTKHAHDEERKKAQAEKRQRDNEKLQEERRLAKEARAKRREEKMRRRITKQLQKEQAEANRAAFSRLTSPTAKRAPKSPSAAMMLKSPGGQLSRMMTPSSRAVQGLATQRREVDNGGAGDVLQDDGLEEEKTQLSEHVEDGAEDVHLELDHHNNKKRRPSHHRTHHSRSPSRKHSHTHSHTHRRRTKAHSSNSPNSHHSDHEPSNEHEDDSFLAHLTTEQDWLHFNPLHPSFTRAAHDGLVPFDEFDCTAIIADDAAAAGGGGSGGGSAVLSSVSGGLLPSTWYTFVYRDAPASLVSKIQADGVYEYEQDEVSSAEREAQRKRKEVQEREQDEDDAIRHSIERRGSLQAYETRQRETDNRKVQQAKRRREREDKEQMELRLRSELERQSAQQQQDEMNAFAEAAAKEQQTLSLLLSAAPTTAADTDDSSQQSEEAERERAMLESAHERLRLRDVSYMEREQREAAEQAAELSALDSDIALALDDVQQQRDNQRYSNTQFLPSLSRTGLASREKDNARETGRRQYAATTVVSSAPVVRSTSPSQQSSDIGNSRSPIVSRPASSSMQPLSSESSSRTASPPDRKQPLQSPKALHTDTSSPTHQSVQKRVAASSILSSQSAQLLSTMSPASISHTGTLGSAQLASLPNSMRTGPVGQLPFARNNKLGMDKPKRGSFVALDPLSPSKRMTSAK